MKLWRPLKHICRLSHETSKLKFVSSCAFECGVETKLNVVSTKCFGNEILFMWVVPHEKMQDNKGCGLWFVMASWICVRPNTFEVALHAKYARPWNIAHCMPCRFFTRLKFFGLLGHDPMYCEVECLGDGLFIGNLNDVRGWVCNESPYIWGFL